MHRVSLPLACLLAACVIDNGVSRKDDDPPPGESGETPDSTVPDETGGTDETADTGETAETDSAEPDPDTCELVVVPAGVVPVGESCTGATAWTPPDDLADITLEWAIPGPDVMSTPIVANLTDDDGDGDVDGDDIPDILVVDLVSGDLYCYAGDGSGTEWVQPLHAYPMAIAAADIDGDGAIEIVYQGADGLCALDHDGTGLWCNVAVRYTFNGGPTVTDLEGDGQTEIIAGSAIVSGETGAVLVNDVCKGAGTFPVVGDLDGDGVKEIVCGASAWAADGTELWSDGIYEYNHAALVDVNADGAPEVLVTGWGYGIHLYAGDGIALASTGITGEYSAACVADFDGDGAPEFAVPSSRKLEMFEADLTPSWSQPAVDISGASSCAAFDFDADGAYELLYADEETFSLYDGATGAVLYEWADHTSGTLWEYPSVVDVDHDGSAEIVVSESYAGNTGVAVFGHTSNGWPPTGPIWPQYTYDGANIGDDGRVLPDPPAPWRGGGFAHARPPGYLNPDTGAWSFAPPTHDLGITFTDSCAADCVNGPLQVSLSVTNAGAVSADAVVVLYAVDDASMREVARSTLTIAPGTRADALVYTLALGDIGTHGWRAVISRAGGGADCDETDNAANWEARDCG